MTDWNLLASNSYKAANLLVQARCERSCASRAYYAAYSRATKALARLGICFPAGREGPSHAKLPELVESHLSMIGAHRWRVSDYLKTLYKLRVIADYRPSDSVDDADAKTAVVLMGHVFTLTQGALQ